MGISSGVDKPRIEAAVREILEAIGEDPQREGLLETPARVARMYEEVFAGMREDPEDHLQRQFNVSGQEEMVIVRDIEFFSFCEHHLLPFIGHAHVAYIPQDGKVTGLSKIARVVDGYAKRLQIQEQLTNQIADAFVNVLNVRGVLVVIEAEHMCMTIRGVKKPGAVTVTSAVRGSFQTDMRTREEALHLLGLKR